MYSEETGYVNTKSEVRRLFDAGEIKSGSDVVRKFGISRARVSQIAKELDIRFPVVEWGPKGKGLQKFVPPKPRPPLIPMNTDKSAIVATPKVSTTHAGAVGEMMVAADLLARGFKPYFPVVMSRSHDIIAVDTKNRPITIECRTARRYHSWGLTYRKHSISQYMAIVVHGEPIKYIPDLPEA